MKEHRKWYVILQDDRAVVRAVKHYDDFAIGFPSGYASYGTALAVADRFNAVAATKEEANRKERNGYLLFIALIATTFVIGVYFYVATQY